MTEATPPCVEVDTHSNGVVELVLSRPEALNALSLGMLDDLRDAVESVRRDRPRVVVLSSACERAFSVGADLKERSSMSAAELLAARPQMVAGYRCLLGVDCPVVAAIHGYCLGGGLELALTCDVLVCERDSILGFPEVTIGIIPGGGGTQLVARRAGWGTSADLLFSGRRISGAEAAALGVIDRLVDEDATGAALDFAGSVARNSPAATRAAKRALTGGWNLPLHEALDIEDKAFREVLSGPDREEGLRAFRDKNEPHWPSALD